ncbi:hypothetical protein [Winogradskyella sp. PG-2]|uniref:hypothetical protein n=1 Tax=Winogradskyella sp. PG-2 TaxID=754409 RepID=UPI0004588570|nr:hypothetical protein [Winogradskyella sp. PG-2]BAO76774.1 hypothetical protein WPG_2544 [Winogradskyella sp. PG-2]
MKNLKLALLAFIIVFATACKDNKKENEETEDTNEQVSTENEVVKISIAPLTDSPAYADAKLMLDTSETMVISEASEVDFDFGLENYALGEITDSPNKEKLANSGKGQHIHFILNNQPYSAHYEPNIKKEIPAGVHHLVAFLSRSYHESVKNDNSMVVRKLVVGENAEDSLGLQMDSPTLIYSRPKGTYVGKDAENILLDFFVLNTELSETGHKVIATINGEEFTITQWVPHVITGLPMGEVSIALKIVDTEGNILPGPFNSVERKVTLKAL